MTIELTSDRNPNKIVLTTEHAMSSYGVPVLLMDGQAYGPSDALPTDEFFGTQTAAQFCAGRLCAMTPASERDAIHKFCESSPEYTGRAKRADGSYA